MVKLFTHLLAILTLTSVFEYSASASQQQVIETLTYFENPSAKTCEINIKNIVKDGSLPPIEKTDDINENDKDICIIFLCRHGKTASNKLKIIQGVSVNDSILETEIEKCKQYADYLKKNNFNFENCYSSDLHRAQETLKGIIQSSGIESSKMEIEKAFTDVDYGDFEKKQIADVIDTPEFNKMYEDLDCTAPNGKDTYKNVIIRMFDALNEIATDHLGQKALVVSSQYPINLFCALVNGKFFREVENFSKIKILWKPGVFDEN